MFDSIERSWRLVKASYNVLQSDRELLVYPVVSFIGSILVVITFFLPMLVAGLFDGLTRGDSLGIASIVIMFLFYLVMYTVVIFSNTALVGGAMIRLNGGDPTLADGFKIARDRFPKIVGYALVSATVGMILRAVSERGGLVGQIIIGIIGFVWSIATFLVVPVLVVEDIGPIDAVKRSAELLKRTWGEQITANFGFSAVFGLISFGIIMLGIVLMAFFGSLQATALVLLAGLGMVLALIAVGLLSSTLSGIYQAALYRYATEGVVPEGFSDDMIQGAFKEKRKRGLF
ncbi:MAG: glycerophosphoryl diester phosphodiesterase membrane domain-containing protein [Anaerolineae bacterium]|nr:glycerophosphoryl diester phosphodiesterase membrane domain-containing protein [Anaerolineae bacterium]